jgi:hypothetical protein
MRRVKKSHDGWQPSSDSGGSNDKDSNPGSGSDTDSIDGGTSNGNSGQSQAPEDKQGLSKILAKVYHIIRRHSTELILIISANFVFTIASNAFS